MSSVVHNPTNAPSLEQQRQTDFLPIVAKAKNKQPITAQERARAQAYIDNLQNEVRRKNQQTRQNSGNFSLAVGTSGSTSVGKNSLRGMEEINAQFNSPQNQEAASLAEKDAQLAKQQAKEGERLDVLFEQGQDTRKRLLGLLDRREGPSAAESLLNRATGQAISSQKSLASTGRGNIGLKQARLARNVANIQGAQAARLADLRMNEAQAADQRKQAILSQLGSLSQNQAGQAGQLFLGTGSQQVQLMQLQQQYSARLQQQPDLDWKDFLVGAGVGGVAFYLTRDPRSSIALGTQVSSMDVV